MQLAPLLRLARAALLAAAATALALPAAHAQYSFAPLPNAPGADFTFAYGLNDLGSVVGYTFAYPSTPDGDYVYNGFVYASGQYTTLNVPGYETTSIPSGINNAGQVVVQASGLGPELYSYLYSGGTFTQIPGPLPGTRRTAAYAINNLGQIAGNFRDPATDVVTGFLYSGGAFTTFGFPGATRTFGYGLNDLGQVVGYYRDAGGVDHGYVWTNGSFSTFDVPGASGTVLSGINAGGQILGSYVDANGAPNDFVYSAGVYTSLNMPGVEGSSAYAINNRGQVVGQYFTFDAAGKFTPGSFLATPTATVPEPATLALVAGGLGALGAGARRARRRPATSGGAPR